MAEGVVDQRWLLWLEAQSDQKAWTLAANLRHKIGGVWADANRLSNAEIQSIRDSVVAMYRQLN